MPDMPSTAIRARRYDATTVQNPYPNYQICHRHRDTLTRSDTNTAVKTLDQLLTAGNDRIIFSCIAGSRAYGTQVPGSDEDVRGIYVMPSACYCPLIDNRSSFQMTAITRCTTAYAAALNRWPKRIQIF
jgi:hypothetical protein